MILSEIVKIIGNGRNISHFRKLGYDLEIKQEIDVKVEHLKSGSDIKILVSCDICDSVKTVTFNMYYKITNELQSKYHCSNPECTKIKIKESNEKIYGCHPSKLQTTKEKVINTNKSKFGTEYYSQLESTKNSKKKKFLDKYGVDNPSKLDFIKSKKIETSIKNWNSEHPMKNEYVKKKCFDSQEINKHPFTNKSFLKDVIDTKQKNILYKYKKIVENDEYEIIDNTKNEMKILHKKCDQIFYTNYSTLRNRLNYNITLCTNCFPISESKSVKEKDFVSWLRSLNLNIKENDRNILNGKELDIYIPEYNLAIEFNGLYWHSEKFKDKNYHLDKSLKCSEQGIRLLHVWEDEWIFKQDVVKSTILDILNMKKNFKYKDLLTVKVLNDKNNIEKFVSKNSLNFFEKTNLNISVFHNQEIIAILCLKRNGKNYTIINHVEKISNDIKYNTFEILFNYLLNNYYYENIYLMNDFRFGNIVSEDIFEKINFSKPSFYLCKGNQRFSKKEIKNNKGYFKLYNCGINKFKYKY